jgi:hypothetical protein
MNVHLDVATALPELNVVKSKVGMMLHLKIEKPGVVFAQAGERFKQVKSAAGKTALSRADYVPLAAPIS